MSAQKMRGRTRLYCGTRMDEDVWSWRKGPRHKCQSTCLISLWLLVTKLLWAGRARGGRGGGWGIPRIVILFIIHYFLVWPALPHAFFSGHTHRERHAHTHTHRERERERARVALAWPAPFFPPFFFPPCATPNSSSKPLSLFVCVCVYVCMYTYIHT